MARVLVTCHHLIRHRATFAGAFAAEGLEATYPEIIGQQFSAEQMGDLLPGHDIVIAGDDFIDRKTLGRAKTDSLKAVIKWGIGVDAIDLVAARELGMPVYNTPGAFADEVADAALGYVLMLARRLHEMHAEVVAGRWTKIEGMTLAGKTAGVVGLGAIGRAVAVRCRAFGMDVVGYDPVAIPSAVLASCGASQASLDEVLGRADFIILACALTPESRHLLNAAAFARAKPGARVVNVARGPVIDEPALIDALRSGKLAGAALDVYEEEPLPAGSPLRTFSNVVFGTHNSSNTAEAVHRVNALTVGLACDILKGRPARIRPLVDV
ncbi:MAG: phosphoglycerate dehydrogenase [Beijerinckiaceae bacterium]|nr:phosphoglycerate dehydrogenase [Beijerinckiaceae bacterium]